MRNLSFKMLSLFGITHCSYALFSTLNLIKSKLWNRIVGENSSLEPYLTID